MTPAAPAPQQPQQQRPFTWSGQNHDLLAAQPGSGWTAPLSSQNEVLGPVVDYLSMLAIEDAAEVVVLDHHVIHMYVVCVITMGIGHEIVQIVLLIQTSMLCMIMLLMLICVMLVVIRPVRRI